MEWMEPKNKRTVGIVPEDMQIHIEDYVYTYLRGEKKSEAAILTGKSVFSEGNFYIYITGAIACPGLTADGEFTITKRVWNYVYQELHQSFDKQEIVGWYMPIPEEAEPEVYEKIQLLHERDFSGADMVFFCRNEETGEESFFARRDGRMLKLPGYFIYYEKNPKMRAYILLKREEQQLEEDLKAEQKSDERVVMRYREYMNSHQMKETRSRSVARSKAGSSLAYMMCVLALLGMFLLSIGIVAGYQQVHEMDDVMTMVEDQLHLDLSGE